MPEPAFYVSTEQRRFRATELTRGPWSPDHQHAGPPAALLARAVEAELPTDAALQVVRLTVEILRPVPITELTVTTEVVHAGRKLRMLEATLADAGGKPLLRARAVALRTEEMALPQTVPGPVLAVPEPAQSSPFELPFFTSDTGYHKAMEIRIARGEFGCGPVAAWMRMRVPLVAGERPSPLQRVVTAADSGNGVSLVLDTRRYTFVNPDLSVYLHRQPVGEWVGLDAVTTPQAHGIGLADTLLLDERGPIGRGCQSLIIQRREA